MDVNFTKICRIAILSTILVFSFNLSFAQVLLGSQDFDGGGLTFVASSDFNDSGNDHFSDTNGSDITNQSGAYSFDNDANLFWAAEDTDDNGGNGIDEQTLTFSPVSIAGYEGITVCLDVAAGNETFPGNYDATDYLIVQYSTDLNPALITGSGLSYKNNGDASNEQLHHDINLNGNGDGPQITLTAQNICFVVPNDQTICAGATELNLVIEVHMDSGAEEVAFDNITITGIDSNTPLSFNIAADLICVTAGVQMNVAGGSPVGGVYSGPGVTDNGNGINYDFDPAAAGVGTHTITYTSCAEMVTDQIQVFAAPEVTGVVTDEGCGNATDGAIDITVVNPNGYNVLWSNGATTEDLTNLSAGMYTVVVTDQGGLTCSATETFTVGVEPDTEDPAIICPADLTIECDVMPDPGVTGLATATDNCSTPSDITITSSDNVMLDGCGGYTGTIIRTWTATDAAGRTASCDQTITIEDTQAPTFTVPDDVTENFLRSQELQELILLTTRFTFITGTEVELLLTSNCQE